MDDKRQPSEAADSPTEGYRKLMRDLEELSTWEHEEREKIRVEFARRYSEIVAKHSTPLRDAAPDAGDDARDATRGGE